MVAEVCRRIDTAETPPTLKQLAEHAGLSPWHLHRLFKSVTGLTPKAYATAQRSERVRAGLATQGATVTSVIYAAGYNANGRFYEGSNALLGMTPSTYRAGVPTPRSVSPSANARWAPFWWPPANAAFVPFCSATIQPPSSAICRRVLPRRS